MSTSASQNNGASEAAFDQSILPLTAPPPGSEAELRALLEALLLVAPEPPTVAQLAEAAGVAVELVEAALSALAAPDRGWTVLRHRDTVQLASAPRFAEHVRRFLGMERTSRLSGAALETLAVIAYRQPVTRAEIEAVRGVDCAGVLATLHGRGLIESVGRLETVGHPLQYGTTPAFLRHFGLQSLADLPPLGKVEGRDASLLLEAAMTEAETPDQPTDGRTGQDSDPDAMSPR